MNPAVVRVRNDEALRRVLDEVTAGIAKTLGSLVDRPLQVTPAGNLRCVPLNAWLESIAGTMAVVRGTLLGGDSPERYLLLAIDLIDAITLSGHMMLTSEEVIAADRDAGEFGQEHHEAFSEVSNILCSSISGALRRQIGAQSGMRVRDFATIETGSDPQSILGTGTALVHEFTLQFDGYPASQVSVLLDPETGQSWNAESLVLDHPKPRTEPLEPTASGRFPAVTAAAEGEERVTRSEIAAFVTNIETASILRECSDHLGIEIRHHARTDIPNPAAHTREIVLIEVPVGEEKRFEWAKRLKQYHRDIAVVLLIHEPSRPRVVQGLLTKSNVILAWPSKEEQLRTKLEPLLGNDPGDEGTTA